MQVPKSWTCPCFKVFSRRQAFMMISLTQYNTQCKNKIKASGEDSGGRERQSNPMRNSLNARFTAAVPNVFGTRTNFVEDSFFMNQGSEGWFQDYSSSLHLLRPLFLLLLHQLHLRSSGIRSQRLGIPAIWDRVDLLWFRFALRW